MLIGNIVTDVVAILKKPEFCVFACFCRYALPLGWWHKPILASLDNEQWACNLLRYTLQVELL
jgi:hypothetical protein